MSGNYGMTDLEHIVADGIPDGWIAHVDGPEGWQAIDHIEAAEDPRGRNVVCQNGITYLRALYAPVFLSPINESGS